MILITHDLGVVNETCDNVAVVYAGKIIESGKNLCLNRYIQSGRRLIG